MALELIVAEQGVDPLSPELRRLERELAQTSAEVAALPQPALNALGPALAQAQRETVRDLGAWLRKTDGETRYTAQVHRTVLAQLDAALGTIARIDPVLSAALAKAGIAAGTLSATHLTSEIARYSQRFEGAPRHVPLNLARLLATGERELIPRFRASAARYAGQVGDDIRRELAVGILRRESVSEMVSRLARLGGPRGPVALRGVAGEPGAQVEHIGEGLFRRYRWWGERVVRTEVQRAYNVQIDEGLREARATIPDLKRRWDASLDLRVCPACSELHGSVADIEGNFLGGVTDAPLHPNCRCRVGAWRDAWGDALEGRRPPTPAPAPRRETLPPPPMPVRRPATLPPPPKPVRRGATMPPPPMPVRSPPRDPTAPPTFRTLKDAQAWCSGRYPAVTWDLKGLHVDALNDLLPELHRLARAWPEVMARLKYFGTYREVKYPGRAFRWGPRVYAHASQDGARIGLNPAWFGKPDKIRAALARDAAAGWHPPGTEHMASVLTHEWGHQVDHLLALRPQGLPLDGFRRAHKATAALSRYALTNASEGFAEAFASLRYTPAAAQTDFTRGLGQLLDGARASLDSMLPRGNTPSP